MAKKKNQKKTEQKIEIITSKPELDLSALKRFENLEGQEFKLSKIGSKRPNYRVDVGKYEIGEFSFHVYEASETLPEQIGVYIAGRGFNFLRTSPIIKITNYDEKSVQFETEGGIYLLEKL